MPYNFAAECFTQRNSVADFLREKPNFKYDKNGHFALLSPLRLIVKFVVDFLLVIIELFLLDAFVSSQFTCLMHRQTDGFAITNTAYIQCIMQCDMRALTPTAMLLTHFATVF